MQLPRDLWQGIEKFTSSIAGPELARAAAELTTAYRSDRSAKPELDYVHRAAYLITRLPATYAVLTRILRECKLRLPNLHIESMLDLGAGPGTALWAGTSEFPELNRAVLVEDSVGWIEIGERLTGNLDREPIRAAEWRQESVVDRLPDGSFDLVTISYVLNELRPTDRASVLLDAWERASKLLLIVEPGTPRGFQHLRELRTQLIATGAHVVAPCPHEGTCPMKGTDWCHFAERLERTSEHRLAKSAELGYEDEKYSYIVFAREAVVLPASRVLRHPRKHSGHVELELCTPEGLKRETVSRKHGDRYKVARKAEWGDALYPMK